jgi:HNH endonuclease
MLRGVPNIEVRFNPVRRSVFGRTKAPGHALLIIKVSDGSPRISFRFAPGLESYEHFQQVLGETYKVPLKVLPFGLERFDSTDTNGRSYWLFRGKCHWDTDDLGVEDVKALLLLKERRQERKIVRAKTLMAQAELPPENRRQAISGDVKLLVWQRDGGQCVRCSSRTDLQFDHIIPVALGGGSAAANIQILCGSCNRQKRDNLS